MQQWIVILIGFGLFCYLGITFRRFTIRRGAGKHDPIEQFRLQRELLEAKFVEMAPTLGKPRGLRWKHCEWKPQVRFAREVETGLLTAFAGVEIHFEAIEGGGMEDLDAVHYFREASAVFHWQNGRWGTGGKALFNMQPDLAIERLEGQFEPISVESNG